MTGPAPAAAVWGGVELLERAIGYMLGSLRLVTEADYTAPTPCTEWDLRALLDHMNDSLEALQEAVDVRRVDRRSGPAGTGDPVAALRDRACRLLGGWANDPSGGDVSVDGRPLTTRVLTSAGALEVATHGWDVAEACGARRPVPEALAEDLLRLVPLLVTAHDRPGRFGPVVDVPATAAAGDRLLGLLGRDPYRRPRRAQVVRDDVLAQPGQVRGEHPPAARGGPPRRRSAPARGPRRA